MEKHTKNRLRPYLLPLILILGGGLLGYLYYLTIGCVTGTCAITSNPLLSTLYGAIFGFLISILIPTRKKVSDSSQKEDKD